MAYKDWREDEEIRRRVENRDLASGGAKAALYSDDDYGQSLMNSKLWFTADEAGKAALHDENQAIAKKYGADTGVAGDEWNRIEPIRTDTYENTIADVTARMADYDKFLDPYKAGLDAKYSAIQNRQPFSYDYASDPAYQAYAKEYTRLGQRAMDDTLAKVSARTGGLASSYAATAGNQAYGNYMAQLSDKIPELYKLAYEMYADQANRDISDLAAIRGLSGDAYGRWGDEFDRLGTLYGLGTSERSYADSRSDLTREDELARAKLLASMGDYSALDEYYGGGTALADAYAASQAAKVGGGGGRSNGGGSGSGAGLGAGGGDTESGKWADVEAWVALYVTDAAKDYIKEHYKEMGYSTQSAALSGWNNHLLESGFSADEKEYDPSVDTLRASGRMDSHDVMHGIADDLGLDSAAGTGWGVAQNGGNGTRALSSAAQRIQNSIASFSYGASTAEAQAYAADAVEDALAKGSISLEEADYLLSMFGY